MSTEPQDVLVRYKIQNDASTTYLDYTHPFPTFLCTSTPSERSHPSWLAAFVDVLSLLNAQHHEECMSKISTPCSVCGAPTADALKSPVPYLHLVEPMVVVHVVQVCGAKACERDARAKLLASGVGKAEESIYKDMDCEACGKVGAKRCKGCGKVGYCSQACQRAMWKTHKRHCSKRRLTVGAEEAEDPVDLPYETI